MPVNRSLHQPPGVPAAGRLANVAAMDMRGGGVIEPREPDEQDSLADLRAHYDVELVRAPNPGPLTLTGTNSWVVGRSPAWVVDPGPLLEQHLAALYAAIDARGGLGGVALTPHHHDHSQAAPPVADHFRAPGAAWGGAGGHQPRHRAGVG